LAGPTPFCSENFWQDPFLCFFQGVLQWFLPGVLPLLFVVVLVVAPVVVVCVLLVPIRPSVRPAGLFFLSLLLRCPGLFMAGVLTLLKRALRFDPEKNRPFFSSLSLSPKKKKRRQRGKEKKGQLFRFSIIKSME